MSTPLGPQPQDSAFVARVKAILVTPKIEWPVIDGEPTTIADIYRRHVIPLAAIPAVAHLIGSLAFGYSVLGVTWRPSVGAALGTAVVSYALNLVMTYVLALIIDWLAPQFGATANRVQAVKVAAYGLTAGWLAGVFDLIPALSVLGIVGLYSLYLIYLGLPVLMKVPADKAMTYVVVVIVATIAAGLVMAAVIGPVAHAFSPAPAFGDGTMTIGR